MWARKWLSVEEPKLAKCGILRLVRDVFGVSGLLQTTESGAISRIVPDGGSALNRNTQHWDTRVQSTDFSRAVAPRKTRLKSVLSTPLAHLLCVPIFRGLI